MAGEGRDFGPAFSFVICYLLFVICYFHHFHAGENVSRILSAAIAFARALG
jgi:hypothetical protein